MTVTVVLGFIQYYNLYGAWAGKDNNPCVKGDAVFGQGQCHGQPVPHLATGVVTGALFFTTFGLSFAMPDPLNVSEGDGKFAKKLRTHKVLRWVSFSGMVAQMALGAVIEADTDHYEHVAHRASEGLMRVALDTGIPVTFGILTARSPDHALERSAAGPNNKGMEAAAAAVGAALALKSI